MKLYLQYNYRRRLNVTRSRTKVDWWFDGCD